MDVHDSSSPPGGGPSGETRALDLVSQAALPSGAEHGATQQLVSFADDLFARWSPETGPLGEQPLVARLLDRLWSDDPRLGTLIDFPRFEPIVGGFAPRWSLEPTTGYAAAWSLPRWQVVLPREAWDEEPGAAQVQEADLAPAGLRPAAALAQQPAAAARRGAERTALERAGHLARLQSPAGKADRPERGPRSHPRTERAAAPGAPVRPYPRAMGRAGGLAPQLVADRFPLQYASMHELAALPRLHFPVAGAEPAAPAVGREPAGRVPTPPAWPRSSSPSATIGDLAFSREHLPSLGAALGALGRHRARLEPASWLRSLAPQRPDAAGPAGHLPGPARSDRAAIAAPTLDVAPRASRAAAVAPDRVQLGLPAADESAPWQPAAVRSGYTPRAAAAASAPAAIPLDYLWPDRKPVGAPVAGAGAAAEGRAAEPWTPAGLRPIRAIEPDGPAAALAMPWPAPVTGQPGAGPSTPPSGADAAAASSPWPSLPMAPWPEAAKPAGGAQPRRGAATAPAPAGQQEGTADLPVGPGVAGELGGLIRGLLGRLGLPASLAGQVAAGSGPGLPAGLGDDLGKLLRRLSHRAAAAGGMTMIRMPARGPDAGADGDSPLQYKGLLETVGGLLPVEAWGAFRQGVSSAFAAEAGAGELLRFAGTPAPGAPAAAGQVARPAGPAYFEAPRLVGALEQQGRLARLIGSRRERGGKLLDKQGFQPAAGRMAMDAGEHAPLGALPVPGGEERAHGFHLDVDFALMQAMDAWEAAFPGRTPYITPRGSGEGKEEPDFRDQQPLPRAVPPLPPRLKKLAEGKDSAARQVQGLLGALKLGRQGGTGEPLPPGMGMGTGAPPHDLDQAFSMTLVRPIMQTVVERSQVLMSAAGEAPPSKSEKSELGDKGAQLDPTKLEALVEQVYERIWELMDIEKQRRAW